MKYSGSPEKGICFKGGWGLQRQGLGQARHSNLNPLPDLAPPSLGTCACQTWPTKSWNIALARLAWKIALARLGPPSLGKLPLPDLAHQVEGK